MYQRAYKILLVDDDLNCLDSIDQILGRDGYETIKADEGRPALQLFPKHIIDLAIVDFNLPDMNGLHVLREIKRINRNVPIIIMSSEQSMEIRIASLEAGAYSFIAKPINIPIFRNMVAKALQSPNSKTIEVRREFIVIKWFRGFINK
jgi:DNA-binding response OmpR family regulator